MATLRSSLLSRLRQLLSGKAAMGSALRFGDSESVSVSFSIVSYTSNRHIHLCDRDHRADT